MLDDVAFEKYHIFRGQARVLSGFDDAPEEKSPDPSPTHAPVAVPARAVDANGQLEGGSERTWERLLAVAGNRPSDRRTVFSQYLWEPSGSPRQRRKRFRASPIPRYPTAGHHPQLIRALPFR